MENTQTDVDMCSAEGKGLDVCLCRTNCVFLAKCTCFSYFSNIWHVWVFFSKFESKLHCYDWAQSSYEHLFNYPYEEKGEEGNVYQHGISATDLWWKRNSEASTLQNKLTVRNWCHSHRQYESIGEGWFLGNSDSVWKQPDNSPDMRNLNDSLLQDERHTTVRK